MILKAPCQHGRYDEHHDPIPGTQWSKPEGNCPGGSLLPPDSLVIVKEDGEWPKWVLACGQLDQAYEGERHSTLAILDALAAAQPGKVPETELDRNQMGIW